MRFISKIGLEAQLLCTIAALTATMELTCVRPAGAQANLPDGFADELVEGGLSLPVGMTFLPDGRLLVIEQSTAWVRVIVADEVATTDPAMIVPGVNTTGGERGLLGIAVDPGWPDRPYIYIHATHQGSMIRISRFRASGDLEYTGNGSLTIDPGSRYDLLDDIPDDADNHNGGTVRFGPDGLLYVSLGEDATPRAAQDTTSLRGVILRLDVSRLPDGPGAASRDLITPAGNPFASTGSPNARLLWAWGLRNPFRFQVDAANGDLFIADVGQATWEELNWANAPSRNFGWPRFEGPDGFDSGSPLVGAATGPIYALNQNTGAAAIISAGVYRRPAGAPNPWPPSYEGNAFLSDYYSGVLRRLRRVGSSWQVAPSEPGQPSISNWATGLARVSDWAIGPDGSMWYLRQYNGSASSTGQIRRIVVDTSLVSPVPPTPEPQHVDFRPPYPSPASESVAFEFTLSRVASVRLTVFDMRGAVVRRLLVNDTAPVGLNRVTWDGRDDHQRLTSSGLYLGVLEVDGSNYSRRIPIVR